MTDKDNVIIMQLLADMGGISGLFKMLNEEIDRRLQPFCELIDLATLTISIVFASTIFAYYFCKRQHEVLKYLKWNCQLCFYSLLHHKSQN